VIFESTCNGLIRSRFEVTGLANMSGLSCLVVREGGNLVFAAERREGGGNAAEPPYISLCKIIHTGFSR
jgi:hypothetical protein